MRCVPIVDYGHIEQEIPVTDFAATPATTPIGIQRFEDDPIAPQIPALVTKLLSRQEMRTDPKALQAVSEEGQALVDSGT